MKIENAVLKTIFENTCDEEGFREAIKQSLPDEKYRGQLEKNIANDEKKLNQIERDLGKLVKAVLEGTLMEETIKQKEAALYEAKSGLADRLAFNKAKFKSLPSIKDIKNRAEHIRMWILLIGCPRRAQAENFAIFPSIW